MGDMSFSEYKAWSASVILAEVERIVSFRGHKFNPCSRNEDPMLLGRDQTNKQKTGSIAAEERRSAILSLRQFSCCEEKNLESD